ncbi:MAG: hypothetical protein M1150_01615 [Patescibacteria group bacterium]|nr:hypothetical protein [Patescibacteria group bacterium]
MIVMALEGVGGSGKSTVINDLKKHLLTQNFRVLTSKVGGFGDSPREHRLKKIMAYREGLLALNACTNKQRLDKMKDRLFRLALRYQVKRLKTTLNEASYDVVLLDRTPFMSWVYATARDPFNPFLGEIWEEVKQLCITLNLKHIFLLDVDPITAFARLVARVAMIENRSPSEICGDALIEGTDANTRQFIISKANDLLLKGLVQGKPYSGWDYVPFKVMVEECRIYREFLSKEEQTLIPATIINGENQLSSVVSEIERKIYLIREE